MCLVSLAVKMSFMATSLSVCVDYMQYILSYCSCSCPLSSLCSLSCGGGARGRGPASLSPRPPLSAVLVKPVEVCGISCSVAFAKNKKRFVKPTFFFSPLPFGLCKTSFRCFFWSSFSLCCCFLLLCSLIQTSLSCCPFSQRRKDSLTSSKVYGAMFLPLRNSGNRSFRLLND